MRPSPSKPLGSIIAVIAMLVLTAPAVTPVSAITPSPPTNSVSTIYHNTFSGSIPFATGLNAQSKTFYAQGHWWSFFIAGNSYPSNSTFYYSSANGKTWSNPTQFSTKTPDDYELDTCVSGLTVYYVVGNKSSNAMYYRYGTLQVSGSISWSIPETSFTITYADENHPSCWIDGSGNLWVSLQSLNGGTWYDEVWKIVSGTPSLVTSVSEGSARQVDQISGDSSEIAVVLGAGGGSANGALGVFYSTNGGTSWSSINWTSGTQYYGERTNSRISGTTVQVASSSNNELYYLTFASGTGWTSTDLGSGSSPVLSADTRGDLLIFYVQNFISMVYIESQDSGTTWSTPVTLYTEAHCCIKLGEESGTKYASAYLPITWFNSTSTYSNLQFSYLFVDPFTVVTIAGTSGNVLGYSWTGKVRWSSTTSLFWAFYYNSTGSDEYFATSSNGRTWNATGHAAQKLGTTSADGAHSSIYMNGTTIAWVADGSGNQHFFTRFGTISNSGGLGAISWTDSAQTVNILYNTAATFAPSIDIDGSGNQWVSIGQPDATTNCTGSTACDHAEVFEGTACGGSGCTWANKVDESSNPTATQGHTVTNIMVGSSIAAMTWTWQNNNAGTIYITTSTDGGTTWSSPVGTTGTYVFQNGQMAIIGTTVYRGLGKTSSNSCVLGKWTSNSWTESSNLASNSEGCTLSRGSDNTLYLFYQVSGNTGISYIYSQNSGTTWSSPISLVTGETMTSNAVIVPPNVSTFVPVAWQTSGASPFNVRFADTGVIESVTVQSTPSDVFGALTVDGTAQSSPATFLWNYNSTHTLTAAGTTNINKYAFSFWSDAGARSHSVTITAPTTYTSTYVLSNTCSNYNSVGLSLNASFLMLPVLGIVATAGLIVSAFLILSRRGGGGDGEGGGGSTSSMLIILGVVAIVAISALAVIGYEINASVYNVGTTAAGC